MAVMMQSAGCVKDVPNGGTKLSGDAPASPCLLVEENSAGRVQLLQEIEVGHVTSEHSAAVFPGTREKQGIVQDAAALVFCKSLQAGKRA